METIKLPSFETEIDNDAMMYNAIYEYAPVWPRWERLSDVQALLSVETSKRRTSLLRPARPLP